MNRICLTKEGKLIEMQSGGESEDREIEAMRLNALKQNALNAGYKEEDIEVKWVTDEEWASINEAIPVSYIEKRRAEYPPITDYIDGIVKGDSAQVQDYINKCLAVKAKYPKT